MQTANTCAALRALFRRDRSAWIAHRIFAMPDQHDLAVFQRQPLQPYVAVDVQSKFKLERQLLCSRKMMLFASDFAVILSRHFEKLVTAIGSEFAALIS
jgi:hypothetical protein